MDRYIRALESYIQMFGNDDDINEYVSTWDYNEEDFRELAKKLEYCVIKRKKYKNIYVSILQKIYYKTIYNIIARNIEDL